MQPSHPIAQQIKNLSMHPVITNNLADNAGLVSLLFTMFATHLIIKQKCFRTFEYWSHNLYSLIAFILNYYVFKLFCKLTLLPVITMNMGEWRRGE